MSNLIKLPEAMLLDRTQHGFFDNFDAFVTAGATSRYTVVTVTDGTVTQLDVAEGGVAIKSAVASAAGNEDCYLVHEQETFLFAAGKALHFEALVSSVEDDTNQNNLFVGLTNGAAADLLINDGAGVKTSGNTIGFYKVDGGTNWGVHWRDDGDLTTNSVLLTAANTITKKAYSNSATKQRLSFDIIPRGSSTKGDIEFFIDGVLVYKVTDFTLTGNTDVQPVCGCKDGDAGDEVTIKLYSWGCYQTR